MTSKVEYVNYKINKAQDAVKIAQMLYDNGFYQDALSKIYYAAFYAVSSLMRNLNLNPKTHLGAKALFHKEFVQTGIIDKKTGTLYDNLLAKRFEADYEYFALIDPEDIPKYIEEIKLFIEKAKEIIQQEK